MTLYTFNKHIRWRKENPEMILICDCKRLLDFKLPIKYALFIKELNCGVNNENLNGKNKSLFSDFEKMKMLSELNVRELKEKDFQKAMEIFDQELGAKRVRDSSFLHEKFKQYPQFFLGLFLEKDLIGVICGFPREDYLLLSEIAIDSRFHNRDFGKRLVSEFEKRAKKGYNKINAGAQDNVIGFYSSLGYSPFLLIQFEKGEYNLNDFKKFKIESVKEYDGMIGINLKIDKADLNLLKQLEIKYPNAHLQFIFSKRFQE